MPRYMFFLLVILFFSQETCEFISNLGALGARFPGLALPSLTRALAARLTVFVKDEKTHDAGAYMQWE